MIVSFLPQAFKRMKVENMQTVYFAGAVVFLLQSRFPLALSANRAFYWLNYRGCEQQPFSLEAWYFTEASLDSLLSVCQVLLAPAPCWWETSGVFTRFTEVCKLLNAVSLSVPLCILRVVCCGYSSGNVFLRPVSCLLQLFQCLCLLGAFCELFVAAVSALMFLCFVSWLLQLLWC